MNEQLDKQRDVTHCQSNGSSWQSVGDIIYQIYVLTIEMTKLLNENCLLLNYKSTTE